MRGGGYDKHAAASTLSSLPYSRIQGVSPSHYLVPIIMRQLLLVLPLFLASAFSHAEACRAGVVVRLVGEVSLARKTNLFPPFLGLQVCQGDRFITGPASIAELRLRDGTLITVGRDSEFVIREYRLYKEQPNVATFDLVRGAFRSITGLITKRPSRYEVHSRVATIGVRGTDFWGGYGLTENGFDVVMLEGHGIYIDSASGGHLEISEAGQGSTVINGSAPSAAKVWSDDKLKKAIATITP